MNPARLLGATLLLLVLGAAGAVAQAQEPPLPPDPAVLLAKAPWPGMTAWDVDWCKRLVWTSGLVEVREPGAKPRVVWVKDVRGWLKPNGFFGLKVNGTPVDEGTVWLPYGGRMTNLRVLFTYGSDPAKDVSPFRD